MTRKLLIAASCLALLFAALLPSAALAQLGATVPDWPVPSAASTGSGTGGMRALGDIGNPVAFVAVTPCRVVDTRGPAGTYGGPILAAGPPRNFNIPAGPCTGIPASATSFSLNITATGALGPGFLKVFPQGGAAPVVSTLNYLAGQTVANAAIVPAFGGGISVVAGVSGTHLIIDINGYFIQSGVNTGEFFGIYGNFPAGGTVFGENDSDTNGSSGVRGRVITTTGTNSAGVQGESNGGTGVNFGVLGRTLSTTGGAAGVFGQDATASTGTNNQTAGVTGSSKLHIGVEGLSDNAGVRGELYNGSGSFVTLGILGLASGPYGVWATGNLGASGTKSFVEPHPYDASKVIRYVALEGPEAGTYFRGRGRFENRTATIDVPEDFRLVTDAEGLTVQVTPIGEMASVAVVSMSLDGIVVKSTRDVEFFYMVNGIRRSQKEFQPIGFGREYMPDSPSAAMPLAYTPVQREMLISNGTYNADGTPNLATAERLGWARIWAEHGAPQTASPTAAAPGKPDQKTQ